MSIYDNKGDDESISIIRLDDERRKRLSAETIEAIKFISAKGNDDDLDMMSKLLLLKEDALKIIREETDTTGWTKQEYDDAAMQLIIYLAKRIKESINGGAWYCRSCGSSNYKKDRKCWDCGMVLK